MSIELAVRAASVASQKVQMAWRWLWYNLRAFIWFTPAPLSTKFYGRLDFTHLPVRIRLGRRCGIGENVYLAPGREALIVLGDEVTLNRGCMLVAAKEIHIGNRVSIGEYVSIRDQEHIFVPNRGVRDQGFKIEPVSIGDYSWIGRGAFIGPGTRIGKNCVVGANSVVHGTFPDGVLIAGAPATVKKTLATVENLEGSK
ncbi:acyltransferase [Sphingorhabdus sp. YGSMI21]|uniref:acyltransferase n=1 Tax=Sphingorhabdus sp. YGSMI21 TaxID=2077182 RepID=UPI000C1F8F7A|nr:acyltransferase [Sphingorhabdus sp. YGSMI21]ATW03123.1 hypothetical protein CHN51_05870 [Sphingorhabdus sp. YGSMI21]